MWVHLIYGGICDVNQPAANTTARILTTGEILHMIRTLSDDSLYDLTSISTQSHLAIIRRSLLTWCLDGGSYAFGEDTDILEDFMREVSIKETVQRVLIGVEDRKLYEDVYAELRKAKRVGDKSFIIQVTQIFSPEDAYIGTYFTCANTYNDWFWCYFVDDTDVHITTDKSKIHSWLWSLCDAYTFITYAVMQNGWSRTFVGSRKKPESAGT